MRRKNTKMLKALMLSAMAFFMLASAHKASAAEQLIYKCTNPKGQISFQDFACKDNQKLESLKIEINQSADIPVGLRPAEKDVLARLHESQMLDQVLKSPKALVVYQVR